MVIGNCHRGQGRARVLRRMAGLRLVTHPCFILGTRHNAIRSQEKRAFRTRVWLGKWGLAVEAEPWNASDRERDQEFRLRLRHWHIRRPPAAGELISLVRDRPTQGSF